MEERVERDEGRVQSLLNLTTEFVRRFILQIPSFRNIESHVQKGLFSYVTSLPNHVLTKDLLEKFDRDCITEVG